MGHTPMLGDLAVAHAHDVDGFTVDASTDRCQTQECSLVCAMIRLVRRHQLPVGGLSMDICVEIGECRTKRAVQASCAVSIGSAVWLGCMVNEVDGEELLEDVEVPTALHFFGIPADDSFRGIGRHTSSFRAHWRALGPG